MSPSLPAPSRTAVRDLRRLPILVANSLDEEGAKTKLDPARAQVARLNRRSAAEAALDATDSPDFIDEPAALSSAGLDAA